jgi:hypothetical protein
MKIIKSNFSNLKHNKKKVNLTKKWFLISLATLLHLLGIFSSLLRAKKGVPFHLSFHLLRFFSWWSVHTSILTILATIVIWWERKKTPSYFSQLLIFVATIYNLTTFGFLLTHFLIGALKSYGFCLDLLLFGWHFAAPFLTIYYFYSCAPIDLLRKKIVKTFLLSFIFPVFYFFYVWILAKINVGETSSLFPYMEKYPYDIFKWIAEREWVLFITNFLIASLACFSLFGLITWTKIIYDKKINASND